jgi:antitoxin ParD1/3/4
MNVSLTPELEKFVAKEVGSGMYQTASEVIRAALRLLQSDKKARSIPKAQGALEKRLLEGIERLDRGEGVSADEVFKRLDKRIAKAKARG